MIVVALGLLILVATRAHAGPDDESEVDGSEEEREESDGTDDQDWADLTNDDAPIEALTGGRGSRADNEDDVADPDRLAELLEDASIDDPLVRDAIETGVVFTSTAFADAAALSDLELRHPPPSRFGRLDLTVGWQRGYQLSPLGAALDGRVVAHESTMLNRREDTLLLLATWRI